MNRKHVDGLLNNDQNATHVLAAVQALLHTSSMVDFLLNDEEHRSTCRTLLQCMLCSLYNVYNSMEQTGIGNPLPLVRKWNSISSQMTPDQQVDPLLVLEFFIDAMRMEHVGRKKDFDANYFHSSPLASMWKSVFICEVLCPSCGKFEGTKRVSVIKLMPEEVVELHRSIQAHCLESQKEKCMQCDSADATVKCLDVVQLAECLTIYVEKFASNFLVTTCISVWGVSFQLRSLIAYSDNGEEPVVIVVCPDGQSRKIQDKQITKVNLTRLLMTGFFHEHRVTFIYEKKPVLEMKRPTNAIQLTFAATNINATAVHGSQVIGFPDLPVLPDRIPECQRPDLHAARSKDASTQCIQTVMKDASTQCSPTNFEQQGNTYSSYKSHNVLVFSVGISCHGATIFCSEGMEGCMSDKEVILKSGLLDRLKPGDGIMTDRGYELTAELQAIGCEFYKPPTLGGRANFTPEEEILTKAIASARIYTEHAMAEIKDNRLLQGVISLTLIPVISDLVYIAAYMRNFKTSRILNKNIVPRREDEAQQGEDPNEDADDPTG